MYIPASIRLVQTCGETLNLSKRHYKDCGGRRKEEKRKKKKIEGEEEEEEVRAREW